MDFSSRQHNYNIVLLEFRKIVKCICLRNKKSAREAVWIEEKEKVKCDKDDKERLNEKEGGR